MTADSKQHVTLKQIFWSLTWRSGNVLKCRHAKTLWDLIRGAFLFRVWQIFWFCNKSQIVPYASYHSSQGDRKFSKGSESYVPLSIMDCNWECSVTPDYFEKMSANYEDVFIYFPITASLVRSDPRSFSPLRASKRYQVLIYITALAAANGWPRSGACLNIPWGDWPILSE